MLNMLKLHGLPGAAIIHKTLSLREMIYGNELYGNINKVYFKHMVY